MTVAKYLLQINTLGLSIDDLTVMDFAEVHELTVEKSKSLKKANTNEPREATEEEIKSFFGV